MLLVVGHIDASRCAVVAEGAGGGVVEALAVDGEVVASCDAPHVAVEGHGLAVGEDEGDVVVEPDSVGVGDVGADVVGAGGEAYVAFFIHGLMSVEGDGAGLAGGAVGFDVGYGDGLAGATEGSADADDDVGVGHGERRAFEGAGVSGVGILVAFGNVAADAVAEVEAHHVAVARIKNVVVEDARAVTGDAGSAVCSGRSGILHGDIIVRRDAAGLLALGGAEGLGVEAVVKGAIPSTGEGGAIAACHAPNAIEGYEAVLDADGLGGARPSHEAAVATAYIVLLEHLAVEEASLKGNGIGIF